MAFNPVAPLNITYKKFTALNAVTSVTMDLVPNTNFIDLRNKPDWLIVNNITRNGTTGAFQVTVQTGAANNLSVGLHTASLSFTGTFQDPDMLEPANYDIGDYSMRITVTDTLVLSIEPAVMNFQYDPDAAIPPEQLLSITSESNWNVTANQSWVTLTNPAGSSSATLLVGVAPGALSFGFYEAEVTIADGNFTRKLTVYLTISKPADTNQFIFVNPDNLEFLSEFSVNNNISKTIAIDATAAWSVISSADWLDVNIASGNSGITDVLVSVDSSALAVGAYFGTLTINGGGIIKRVFVSLRVVSFAVFGLENNTLYFAEDRNILNVGSVGENSFLLLQVEASSKGETEVFNNTHPYFRGIAKATIGLETPRLLPSYTPSNDLSTRIINNIEPLNIKITAFEEQRFSGGIPVVANYENLLFLNGKTPTVPNRACYLPQQITVTNTAVVALSVIAATAPEQAELTGAVNTVINGAQPDGKYLYTVILNLADYSTAQGDTIALSFGGQTCNITIDNEFTERTLIAFENEWREFEFFECKGFIKKNAVVSPITTEVGVNGKTVTRVLEAYEDTKYTVNTGFIQTDAEVLWLSKILNSKNTYLFVSGVWVPVILTNKNLEVYQTRNNIHAFALNFDNAIK